MGVSGQDKYSAFVPWVECHIVHGCSGFTSAASPNALMLDLSKVYRIAV